LSGLGRRRDTSEIEMSFRTVDAFGDFPRTTGVWDLVQRVQAGTARRETLDALLTKYRAPLKAHLVVRKKLSSDQADDLLQSFIENKILRLRLLESADRAKGRFRSFLLTSLDRFLIDQFRKRAAPVRYVADLPAELPQEPEESEPFNVAWARQLINDAAEQMCGECETSKRPEVWGVFVDRVLDPCLHGAPPAPYDQLVTRFGFESPAQASNVLVTAKRMFRRCIEAVVAEYADGNDAVREELDFLQSYLGAPRRAG
jgi:DNA-directed RNA polymerase specialized sigma24 family protein